MGETYANEHGLGEYAVEFAKGAVIAQNPEAFESAALLDEEDKVRSFDLRSAGPFKT